MAVPSSVVRESMTRESLWRQKGQCTVLDSLLGTVRGTSCEQSVEKSSSPGDYMWTSYIRVTTTSRGRGNALGGVPVKGRARVLGPVGVSRLVEWGQGWATRSRRRGRGWLVRGRSVHHHNCLRRQSLRCSAPWLQGV